MLPMWTVLQLVGAVAWEAPAYVVSAVLVGEGCGSEGAGGGVGVGVGTVPWVAANTVRVMSIPKRLAAICRFARWVVLVPAV